MKKYVGKNVRHGDLVFSKINSEIKGKKESKELILALGEFTGHSHRLQTQGNGYIIYKDLKGGAKEFEIFEEPAILVHEEHEEIEFEPGRYKIEIQEEYDYFEEEMRQVVD